MEKESHRMRLRTKLLAALLALVLIAGAAFAAFLYGLRQGREPEPAVTNTLLEEKLQSIQELGTVAYHYTNIGQFENHVDFYGWKVPFTSKSFIVSYNGTIKAGVDLSQARIRVEEETKTVTATLPAGKILSHEIPEDSIQVYDESRSLFNPITIEDYTGFTAGQKSLLEQRAIDEGLLEEAEEKARAAAEAFLSLAPGMEDYTLQIQ